jgi:hypothetical protein
LSVHCQRFETDVQHQLVAVRKRPQGNFDRPAGDCRKGQLAIVESKPVEATGAIDPQPEGLVLPVKYWTAEPATQPEPTSFLSGKGHRQSHPYTSGKWIIEIDRFPTSAEANPVVWHVQSLWVV